MNGEVDEEAFLRLLKKRVASRGAESGLLQKRITELEAENARLDEDRKKKLQENACLRGKLRAADAVMMKIDYAIRCGQLNPRTLIADARLDYGNPDEYEFSRESQPRVVQSETLANHSGDANKMVSSD